MCLLFGILESVLKVLSMVLRLGIFVLCFELFWIMMEVVLGFVCVGLWGLFDVCY